MRLQLKQTFLKYNITVYHEFTAWNMRRLKPSFINIISEMVSLFGQGQQVDNP